MWKVEAQALSFHSLDQARDPELVEGLPLTTFHWFSLPIPFISFIPVK